MRKLITISKPDTQPSKEQSKQEIISLSIIKSILANLKDGVNDDHAATLGQVKKLILEAVQQTAITFGGFPNYYLGADGQWHLFEYTETVLANDPVFNGIVNGTKNGSNRGFTTEFDFLPGTLMIIRNGMFDHNITETGGNGFVFTAFSDPPATDDILVAIYCRFNTRVVLNGVITGTQDGANTTFDVADDYEAGSLMLIRNGIFDHEIVEDTAPTTTFTITNAPGSDDVLYAIYKKL